MKRCMLTDMAVHSLLGLYATREHVPLTRISCDERPHRLPRHWDKKVDFRRDATATLQKQS